METDVPLPLEPATPAAPPEPPADAATPPAEPAAPAPEQTVAEHEAESPVKQRRRHARSHIAAPEDVPRIAALTKKLRETEAELAAAKNGKPAEAVTPTPAAPVTQTTPAAPAQAPTAAAAATAPALVPVAPVEDDPEPDPADYLNDPSKNYVKDQARWEARQAIREENTRVAAATAAARERDYWMLREADAIKAYSDFKAVAYGPSPIPKGSMVDRFIREAAGGLHVLYHLHKNRAELDKMLALPIFDPATNRAPQIEALSQLALRLAPTNGRQAAAPTGSVAPPSPPTRQPRPPNPVRTGPAPSGNEPPGENASVSEHEKFWNQRRRR